MVGKFKLKDNTKIAWDPDTNITWTGEKVNETEITVFVAKCITKGVLIEASKEEEKSKETKEEKIKRLKAVVEQKIKEADAASEEDFNKKAAELETAEKELKAAKVE